MQMLMSSSSHLSWHTVRCNIMGLLVPKDERSQVESVWNQIDLVSTWIRPGLPFDLDSTWIRPGFDLDSTWIRPGFDLGSN
jgi:hypothetical protein